jgi:hypothetical protein
MVAIASWCCIDAGLQASDAAERESSMNAKELIERWIQQIEAIGPEQRVAIPDFESFHSRARTESIDWCRRCLSPLADPHAETTKTDHSYHVAGRVNLDLLRHQYTVGDRSITVFEGVNFLIVESGGPKDGKWTREAIALAVQGVLGDKLSGPVLKYPTDLIDGALISTAPGVDPAMMFSWDDRVDVLLRRGKLYVVCYKRYPPNLGFLHDAQWFEDELRSRRRP